MKIIIRSKVMKVLVKSLKNATEQHKKLKRKVILRRKVILVPAKAHDR